MATPREAVFALAGPGPWPRLDRTYEAVFISRDSLRPDPLEEEAMVGALSALEGHNVAVATLSDPAAFADGLDRLWRDGIGPGLVLVIGAAFGFAASPGPDARLLLPTANRVTFVSVGEEPDRLPAQVRRVGGGVPAAVALVEEQLSRRVAGRVPAVDEDPRWVVVVADADVLLRRVHESLLTVANGSVGTRGSLEEEPPGSSPLVVVEGVYDHEHGPVPVLLPAPLWTRMDVSTASAAERRVLDLRTGVLLRERPGSSGAFRSVRFASRVRPGAVGLRAEGASGAAQPVARPDQPADPPAQPVSYDAGALAGVAWGRTWSGDSGTLAAVSGQVATMPGGLLVERLGHVVGREERHPDLDKARAAADTYRRIGFDALLAEHRAGWARRWENAAISIDGDPDTELAVRFAQFHLLSSVRGEGDVALGARGLSGPVYAGHVFWDTDVFAMPMLAACWPAAARAVLEYRIRRLPAARRAAAAVGCEGARFPWESADTGEEVTPPSVRDPAGKIVPIHTRHHAEHIVAGVAWAAWHYAQWTGDAAFLRGPGRPLLTETARFWASRIRFDRGGAGHLYGVVGPDEYHAPVDDNAFTNVMARWNLRRAADLVEADGSGDSRGEASRWRRAADRLVDGYEPQSGRYEQFAGFWNLEPLVISEVADPPIAADLLLGRERTAGAQVLKQHDVLMLHHLVPDEVAPDSLASNLDFYSPRTAHGSSLAPAIEAALQARAGRLDDALRFLEMACRMDLDDLTGSTAGGLHTATMGGVWQAITFGFLGLRPAGDGGLTVDPRLPDRWRQVELRLRVHGEPMRVRAGHDRVEIDCRSPVTVGIGGQPAVRLAAPGGRFTRADDTWKETP
jgi:trehalose/maltose hydrolase-like predicted phosphorylase